MNYPKRSRLRAAWLAACCLGGLTLGLAGSGGDDDLRRALDEIRLRITEVEAGLIDTDDPYRREQLEEEIDALRKRLDALEQSAEPAALGEVDDELDALRAEAEAAGADQAKKEQQAEAERATAAGRQRSLQAMNPEISFLGDFSYDWSESEIKNQFVVRGVELAFQSTLDPYTRFKGFLGAHQHPPELELHEEAEGDDHAHEISVVLEEAYIEWIALPLNTSVTFGKFRQQYGTLNRWHRHALPSTDVPFALRNVFGYEGLNSVGVHADWQVPSGRNWTHSMVLEVTNPSNESAFGGDIENPAVLLRYTPFFDLGVDDYFEFGFNAVTGPNDEAGDHRTTVSGVDFNYVWEPAHRARYRSIELRGEYIHTDFEEPTGGTVRSDSVYVYLLGKLSRRWKLGLRYDNAELPWDRFELGDDQEFQEGLREEAWTPMATFWQSEFVRLRLQYQYVRRDFTFSGGPETDHRAWAQVTFAAGPHRHESY